MILFDLVMDCIYLCVIFFIVVMLVFFGFVVLSDVLFCKIFEGRREVK